MKKPSPYLTLAALSTFAEMELTSCGRYAARPDREEYTPPPKKCLLPGCQNLREGNKLFCSKEHFGEYQKNRKK